MIPYDYNCTDSTIFRQNLPLEIQDGTPNPIGYDEISGWYGPGAIWAWIFSAIMSYHTLWRRKGPYLNTNGAILILTTNAAAIDILMRLSRVRELQQRGDERQWLREAAPLAAAHVVVVWGMAHMFWHLFWSCMAQVPREPQDSPTSARENLRLAVGRALLAIPWWAAYSLGSPAPLAAMWMLIGPKVFLKLYMPWITPFEPSMIPLLRSMPSFYVVTDSGCHGVDRIFLLVALFQMASCASLVLILFCLARHILKLYIRERIWYVRIANGIHRLGPEVQAYRLRMGYRIRHLWIGDRLYRIFSQQPFLVLLLLPILLLISFPFIIPLALMLLSTFIIPYLCFLESFFRFATGAGRSCITTPCAPQTIEEWDQLIPFVFALLLLGWEIGPSLIGLGRRLVARLGGLLIVPRRNPQEADNV